MCGTGPVLADKRVPSDHEGRDYGHGAPKPRLRLVPFGVLFLISAILAFISPENTFAAIADTLGFIFLIVGMTIGSAAGFEPRPSGYEPAQSYLDLVTTGPS